MVGDNRSVASSWWLACCLPPIPARQCQAGVNVSIRAIDHIHSPSSPPQPCERKAMAVEQPVPIPEETTCAGAPRWSQPSPSAASTFSPRSGERYVRLELHDQGGMGRVWVARDIGLDRDVALKELHPELAENPAVTARFLR